MMPCGWPGALHAWQHLEDSENNLSAQMAASPCCLGHGRQSFVFDSVCDVRRVGSDYLQSHRTDRGWCVVATRKSDDLVITEAWRRGRKAG
jgi:hypothetical protein